MVAASGLATQTLQGFCFAGRKKKSLTASNFGVQRQNRRKLAATTAASRHSRLISQNVQWGETYSPMAERPTILER